MAGAYTSDAVTYTKHVSLDFKRTLSTLDAVLCRACLTKIDGRGMWVSGSIDDDQGHT